MASKVTACSRMTDKSPVTQRPCSSCSASRQSTLSTYLIGPSQHVRPSIYDPFRLDTKNVILSVRERRRGRSQVCHAQGNATERERQAASILAAGKQFQDPIVASFAIGHILPVTAEVKKRWLGMHNDLETYFANALKK
ncbi:hypothetical protein GOP47_0001358 [Adiantum capillus-veneris]|uniref:Uncharacterized protein n=1 Tax=Adiantum capillus-veneris TaxID=13818 RepID=A0A9D4V837_ADICA|nr:hypothetical protein GOP47_0001358 [Adiantum capillus-veneris]